MDTPPRQRIFSRIFCFPKENLISTVLSLLMDVFSVADFFFFFNLFSGKKKNQPPPTCQVPEDSVIHRMFHLV